MASVASGGHDTSPLLCRGARSATSPLVRPLCPPACCRAGVIPSLNIAAGLLGFFFLGGLSRVLRLVKINGKELTAQEVTVIQTCTVIRGGGTSAVGAAASNLGLLGWLVRSFSSACKPASAAQRLQLALGWARAPCAVSASLVHRGWQRAKLGPLAGLLAPILRRSPATAWPSTAALPPVSLALAAAAPTLPPAAGNPLLRTEVAEVLAEVGSTGQVGF